MSKELTNKVVGGLPIESLDRPVSLEQLERDGYKQVGNAMVKLVSDRQLEYRFIQIAPGVYAFDGQHLVPKERTIQVRRPALGECL